MKEFFEKLENLNDFRDSQLKNVLVLAFVGDSLYTTFVRTHLVVHSDKNSGALNKLANKYVCASSQAKSYNALYDTLTSQEQDVARRARNCKLHHTAKNQSLVDYKDATSLESVFGYVYLSGDIERLIVLMTKCIQVVEEDLFGEDK